MIQLSAYGERVVDRLSMLGMWLAVVVSIRNFYVCFRQYKRTRGKMYVIIIPLLSCSLHDTIDLRSSSSLLVILSTWLK